MKTTLIHLSFIKLRQPITAETYFTQLDNMMMNLAEKQPRLVNRDRPILLHDNARPHTANRMKLKILKLDLKAIDHPPYSPNLSPTDYHLFRNLDNFLQGKIFNSQQTVENCFRAFIDFRFPGIYTEKLFISIYTIVFFNLGKNVSLWEFLLVKILKFIIMIWDSSTIHSKFYYSLY